MKCCKKEPAVWDNPESFLGIVKHILKSKCHVKFDVNQLELETPISKGICLLTRRKLLELLMCIQDETGITINYDEIKDENMGTIGSFFSYVSQKLTDNH